MSLSPEERRALEELERRLIVEAPELDALLAAPADHEAPGGRSVLQVWCMLVLLTCAVFMMGVVVLLTSGGTGCSGLQVSSCEQPAGTREG